MVFSKLTIFMLDLNVLTIFMISSSNILHYSDFRINYNFFILSDQRSNDDSICWSRNSLQVGNSCSLGTFHNPSLSVYDCLYFKQAKNCGVISIYYLQYTCFLWFYVKKFLKKFLRTIMKIYFCKEISFFMGYNHELLC